MTSTHSNPESYIRSQCIAAPGGVEGGGAAPLWTSRAASDSRHDATPRPLLLLSPRPSAVQMQAANSWAHDKSQTAQTADQADRQQSADLGPIAPSSGPLPTPARPAARSSAMGAAVQGNTQPDCRLVEMTN